MAVRIIAEKCIGCNKCVKVCPFAGVEVKEKKALLNDKCTSCGACIAECPVEAIVSDKKPAKVADPAGFKDVWVFAEQRGGALKKVSVELLGKGRDLANARGAKLAAVLIGHNVKGLAADLIAHGADIVYVADKPTLENYQTSTYTKVIVNTIRKYNPEIVIYGATHVGRDLAPRVARRLGTGLTADCTELTIDQEAKILLQTRPAFGGNVMATIKTPQHRPQMATVRPGIMKELPKDAARKGEVVELDVKVVEKDMMERILEIVKEQKHVVNLEEARIIVSGGRGVGSKEGFKVLEELAKELGGEVGGSRVAVEKGFIDQAHQVGQTGKTVRPALYIACGISGSIQHRAGMQNSECIVAINKDPSAYMFKIANYGIVGDLHEVVPALTNAIREAKKSGKM